MPRSIRSRAGLSLLVGVLCVSPSAHGQDKPPAKPPFPAPRVWEAHRDGVYTASVSPDGKLVAVGGWMRAKPRGNWVVVYDRATGKERYRLPGLYSSTASPGHFGFTPDGKRIVTFARTPDNGRTEVLEARVADSVTGKPIRTIRLREGQYILGHDRYAVSDKVLVVAGTNEVATVYDLATGKERGNLPGSVRLERIALSRDGRWLVGIIDNSKAYVWDVDKRTFFVALHGYALQIQAVAISADGASCAFAAGGELCVIDRASGTVKARCEMVLLAARLRFTADGKTVVAGGIGPDHGLAFWDWRTSKEIRGGYLKGAEKLFHMLPKRGEEERKAWRWGAMADFGMSDDGKTIAFTPSDGKLHLLEAASPKPPPKK